MIEVCDRCGFKKDKFPLEDKVCEDCCNEMILGGGKTDWSHFDFEK